MQTITIYAAAPEKPLMGAQCNGCGACCAAEPCPVSRLLLAHRSGACPALEWQTGEMRYVCGLVANPAHHLRWLPAITTPAFSRLIRRWIAAGVGCDFDAEIG